MKTRRNHNCGGFTLPEVTLAVGVVAFGLVAVFAILPFGLTAQKDNREETIIRYEVHYWMEALLAGGVPFEELNRVERVEVDGGGLIPIKLSKPVNPNQAKSWAADVCGWLGNTDFNGSVLNNPYKGNYALVKAINGPLYDRIYGAAGAANNLNYANQRDFAFGYIIQVEPGLGTSRKEGRITFYWPIFEPVREAIEIDKDTLRDAVRCSMEGGSLPKANYEVPKMKSKSFNFRTEKTPQQAVLMKDFTASDPDTAMWKWRFYQEFHDKRVGDEITTGELDSRLDDVNDTEGARKVEPDSKWRVKSGWFQKKMISVGTGVWEDRPMPDDWWAIGMYLWVDGSSVLINKVEGGQPKTLPSLLGKDGQYTISYKKNSGDSWFNVVGALVNPLLGQLVDGPDVNGNFKLKRHFHDTTYPLTPATPRFYFYQDEP